MVSGYYFWPRRRLHDFQDAFVMPFSPLINTDDTDLKTRFLTPPLRDAYALWGKACLLACLQISVICVGQWCASFPCAVCLIKSSIQAHVQKPSAALSVSETISLNALLGSADRVREQRPMGALPTGAEAGCGRPESWRDAAQIPRLFPDVDRPGPGKGHIPVPDPLADDRRITRY